MPNVDYIPAGEDIIHDDWVRLWTELDRKLGLMLDGKSPLVIGDNGDFTATFVNARLFGNVFKFLGPNARASFGPGYDHGIYSAAAAALVEESRDESLMVMRTSAGADMLPFSLEAHKRTVDGKVYWLWPNDTTVPEKRYRYAVAELVFEGDVEIFEMPAAWDKYNFFRIHNLSATRALTVNFRSAPNGQSESPPAFSVTVPKYGCICVRRDPGQGSAGAASNYEAPFKYFWRTKAGDPRFLQLLDLHDAGAGKQVYASMTANNVVNPSILFRWIQFFEQPGPTRFAEVMWYRDPHSVYDLGTYHGTLGDATNPETPVGDLIHHRGPFQVRRSDNTAAVIQFDGYGTLRAKLLEAGLDLVEGPLNVSISAPAGPVSCELVGYGTNLLQGSAAMDVYEPAGNLVSLASSYALDARWPDRSFQDFRIATAIETVGTVSWTDDDGVEQPGNISTRTLYAVDLRPISDEPDPPAMRIWRDTIQQAVTLQNFFYATDLAVGQRLSVNPDGSGANEQIADAPVYCAFEQVRFVTTIFGPELHYKMRVNLRARPTQELLTNVLDGLTEITETGDGTFAVQKKVIRWPPVGWGTAESPAFFTPRLTRKYSQRPLTASEGLLAEISGRHPDIIYEEVGIDGADFETECVGQSYVASDVSALGPATLERSSDSPSARDNFGVWQNPDNLGFLMGAYAGGPLNLFMPRVFLLEEIFNTMAAWVNGLVKAKPITWENSRFYFGPEGTPPLGFTSPRFLYAWIDGPKFLTPSGALLDGVEEPYVNLTDARNRWWEATFPVGATTGSLRSFLDEGFIATLQIGQVAQLRTGWYLPIETVMAHAESLGFKFKYELSTTPLGTKTFEANATRADLRYPILDGSEHIFQGALNTYVVWHSKSTNLFVRELFWKTDPGSGGTIKSDPQPGNQAYEGELFEGDNALRVTLDVDAMVKQYLVGALISPDVWGQKAFLVQNYVSAGFTIETVALLTPERTFRHIGSDHSASWEGFIGAARFGSRVLPIAQEGENGPVRVQQCVWGDHIIGNSEPGSAPVDPQNGVTIRFLNTVSLA